MATKPSEQETRLDLNEKDAKALLHDFVYRDDMSVEDIAEHLGRDWDNAYNWLTGQLAEAKDDE